MAREHLLLRYQSIERDTAGSNRSSEDSPYTRRDVLIGHVPTLEQRLQSLQSAWLAKAARSELAAAHLHLHLPLAAGAPLTPDLHLLQGAAAASRSSSLALAACRRR